MNKEFLKWHVLKSDLDRQAVSAKFQEREIWWCSLGCNIGYEQDGKHELFERPVLIVRKFNADLFWGLPLSSKIKKGKYYRELYLHNKQSTLLISQLRTWSGKRLIRRIGRIGKKQFMSVKSQIAITLGLKNGFLSEASGA